MACTIQDASNFYNEAIYLSFQSYGNSAPTATPSTFTCYGDAEASSSSTADISAVSLEFLCTRKQNSCCCWLWIPGGEDRENRDLESSRTLTARVSTIGQCGMSMS